MIPALPKIPKPAPKVPRDMFPGMIPPRSQWEYKDMGHYKMAMAATYTPMWLQVLRNAGWPTDVVVLDFENYYDDEYTMRGEKLSTIEFIMDKRYEALCLSVLEMRAKQPFAPVKARCGVEAEGVARELGYLQRQYGPNLEGCTVVIQNARYDATILYRRHGIKPPYIIDLLGLATAWHTWAPHGLADLCRRFNLPAKGDTKQFKGMTFIPRWVRPKRKGRRKGPPPVPVRIPAPSEELVEALADYANNDAEREWELFTILLPLLSRPEFELPLMRHTLEMYLEPSFAVDYAKAETLLTQMQAELDRAVAPTGLTIEQIRSGEWDQTIADALDASGGPGTAKQYVKPARNCKRGWKIASAKDDPEREQLLKHADPTVRCLMEAKAAVDSWPSHMNRVTRIVEQSRAADGLLPVPLVYHGAHTGRWSGGERINLQNLGSKSHKLVQEIRTLLTAPPGKKLVIVDLAAVEARGVAYIAGEEDLLVKFRNNEEIYCRFAEKVLGVPEGSLRKPRKTDPPGIAKHYAHSRNSIGKIGILGCGYGMGAEKAEAYAEGKIDAATAKDIVDTYRSTYRNIVKFWYDVQRAFIYTAKYDEPIEMARGLRFHTETEPNTDRQVVIITLPSGRELKYHNVSIKLDGRHEGIQIWNEREHKPVRFWGGHLTENIVQAMCRDALAEMILLSVNQGHTVPLHVHDENILMVDADKADALLAATVDVMSTSPPWAPDFPLGAEGKIADHYEGH